MQGQSLTLAGKLLGHANPASTERYAHLDGKYLAAAAERVAGNVASMIAGKAAGVDKSVYSSNIQS